jgi:hypothetical protein
VVLALLLCLATACDIRAKGNRLNQPKELEVYSPSLANRTLTLCFELEVPKSELVYLLRLDYLPYQCIDANNDAEMEWNPKRSVYSSEVEIAVKCRKRTSTTN